MNDDPNNDEEFDIDNAIEENALLNDNNGNNEDPNLINDDNEFNNQYEDDKNHEGLNEDIINQANDAILVKENDNDIINDDSIPSNIDPDIIEENNDEENNKIDLKPSSINGNLDNQHDMNVVKDKEENKIPQDELNQDPEFQQNENNNGRINYNLDPFLTPTPALEEIAGDNQDNLKNKDPNIHEDDFGIEETKDQVKKEPENPITKTNNLEDLLIEENLQDNDKSKKDLSNELDQLKEKEISGAVNKDLNEDFKSDTDILAELAKGPHTLKRTLQHDFSYKE